ncbi:MAG: hypothetical protein ACNA78_02020 [Balneolaceae bacterium]
MEPSGIPFLFMALRIIEVTRKKSSAHKTNLSTLFVKPAVEGMHRLR